MCSTSMNILSVDVGIKNLAYCLLHLPQGAEALTPKSAMKTLKIVKWDTLNLCKTTELEEPYSIPKCSAEGCKFMAKYTKTVEQVPKYYCNKHSQSSEYKMPMNLSAKALNKLSLDELKKYACDNLSLVVPENSQKSKLKLLDYLKVAIATEYLEPVASKPKEVSACTIDLITIGRNMQKQFDAIPQFEQVNAVVIENQLSTLATRMKTLQGMITQYFIMKGVPNIYFVSATNKLKLFCEGESQENNYSNRKKRGVEITKELIKDDMVTRTMFEPHKKKDDLSDCFLQGLWWVCTKK
ncbi:MAG: hypothetical protein FJX80_03325 [Bacteroidetes bacterium]|nr:hypothetical protein [Bacteroidota bacterium]